MKIVQCMYMIALQAKIDIHVHKQLKFHSYEDNNMQLRKEKYFHVAVKLDQFTTIK